MNTKNLALRLLGFVSFILLWYGIIRIAEIIAPESSITRVPDPVEVCAAFGRLLSPPPGPDPLYQSSLFSHAAASLLRMLEGSAIAIAVGIPSALIMGWNKSALYFGGTMVEIIRPIPPIAWIPIAILVFIFNAPIFIVFLGVIFPIILSVISGVRAIDVKLIEEARILGAGSGDIIRKVVLPASVPSMITGIRTGLGVGWMCIVAAEMMGSSSGLGYFIWYAYDLYRIPEMVAGMIVIGVIGWLMNWGLETLERRLTPWRS